MLKIIFRLRCRRPSTSSDSDSESEPPHYCPGDRIIQAKGTWKTLCSHSDLEDDLPLSRLIARDPAVKMEVENDDCMPALEQISLPVRSTRIGTDTTDTEEIPRYKFSQIYFQRQFAEL